jgi:two-component system sensor histidine kinase KdpD
VIDPLPGLRPPAPKAAPAWRRYGSAVALVAVATAMGMAGGKHLALPDLVMLYLLVIMLAAALLGRGPSLVAATLSVLSYDFFFIPPRYTFNVDDERHLLTFAMMFVVGLLISGFTLRIRRQEDEARTREARTAALYALSRDLTGASDGTEAAQVIARHAASTFQRCVALFVAGGDQEPVFGGGESFALAPAQREAVATAFRGGSDGAGSLGYVPLCAGPKVVAVLVPSAEVAPLGPEARGFLDAFARQAALALERARLAEEARAAVLRARTEEMRSALLSAVSHDLRTPLAAITGAATSLREARQGTASPDADLVDTICEEADRLERLVRNLLDMTRLQSGALEVKREWVPIEEIVGSALNRLDGPLAGRAVRTELPADLPLLSVDAVLFEQVFVNLLENAAKYTPAGTMIEIEARADAHTVVIEVADRGPGLPGGSEARIFERFVRGGATGVPGAGLGLAICRGIVEAHRGTIAAENRPGGGARFRLTMPREEQPPAMVETVEEDAAEPPRAPAA